MNNWRVLVVDDQPEITASFKKQLSLDGLEVKVAQNITEADFLIKRYDFEIAILDVMLPDGNGIEVYRMLREKNEDIYVIMMTGNATIENTLTALNEGVNAYLLKPFPNEQLRAAVLQAEKNLELKAENRQLSKNIAQNRQLYENLLNSTSEAILIVDLDFKIQYCNQATLSLLKHDQEPVEQKILHDYIHDGYKVLRYIHQQLVLGKSVAGYRVELKSTNNTSIDAHLSADFLYNEQKHIEGLVINLSNTMIHDELFNRILRKEKLATIVTLANALGHEIRNPINILYGRLQLLAEELDNENFQHAYQSIRRQIDRILKITDLLSKFNLSREDSIPEKIPFSELFELVLLNRSAYFEEKKIKIELQIEHRTLNIEGNQAQMADGFRYLLEALQEFVPAKGEIGIKIRRVKDYSGGLAAELQFHLPNIKIEPQQIFEPYQSKTIQANSLVGLDLTIMQTIFTNYGGRIDVHIQNETDTLLRIRFPEIEDSTGEKGSNDSQMNGEMEGEKN